jgi:ankyrin repeat protein
VRGFTFIALFLCLTAGLSAQDSSDDLLQAIRANDLAGLKSRFARGVDVNLRDSRGTTLLMHAAAIGSTDALRLLLASGADVNAKNQFDDTALILAADQMEKARLLIEKGADVNAVSKLGRTPLIVAANCDGCSAIVKLLLEKGANPNAKDRGKINPLGLAALAGDTESVRLLLAKGAEPDAADGVGYTPLNNAASTCNAEVIGMLLARKPDVNAANTDNQDVKFGKIQLYRITPLMFASTYCSPAVVKTLLDAGARVNDADVRGMTPLLFATSSEVQRPAVVRLLLAAGANANAKSTVGETALDWARKFGNREVIATLEAAGAKQGVAYHAPVRPPAGPRSAGQAAEKATALLQGSATNFFNQAGCVGCHHQPVALLAAEAVKHAGLKFDEGAAKGHVKMFEGQSTTLQQMLLERLDIGGASDGWVYGMLGLAASRYPANRITDTVAAYIAGYQHADGSWWFGGISRAPFEEGRVARTALALRVLQVYSSPALKSDFDRHIARARDFLLKAKPISTDELAMQAAGLHWAGGNDAKVRELARVLAASQRADGGWSQIPTLESDAYATGEALWTLRETGALKVSDAAYQKGVKFLLDTQWADGSWYVRSRAPKLQPYFQSGFPFDHDQWISCSATSWAVRALAPAAELEKRASR